MHTVMYGGGSNPWGCNLKSKVHHKGQLSSNDHPQTKLQSCTAPIITTYKLSAIIIAGIPRGFCQLHKNFIPQNPSGGGPKIGLPALNQVSLTPSLALALQLHTVLVIHDVSWKCWFCVCKMNLSQLLLCRWGIVWIFAFPPWAVTQGSPDNIIW